MSGRVLKLLHVIDEYTREFFAIVVDHSIDPDKSSTALKKAAFGRGRPPEVNRCDNGVGLIADAPTG